MAHRSGVSLLDQMECREIFVRYRRLCPIEDFSVCIYVDRYVMCCGKIDNSVGIQGSKGEKLQPVEFVVVNNRTAAAYYRSKRARLS